MENLYFNYNLHQRINRKSHFTNGQALIRLIEAVKSPNNFMQPRHYEDLSGKICLTGIEVQDKTRYTPYKVLFSNGDFSYRKTNTKEKYLNSLHS